MAFVNDTIAAISTPPGKGGVALIRISGSEAFQIADRVFLPSCKRALSSLEERKQYYGRIMYGERQIDDGMAVRFVSPASYTGEDTVEICCHGGVLIQSLVLEAVYAAGARPADRGEFTRRAFISGKLSLTDIEAIGGLLEAESQSQIDLYSGASRQKLTDELESVRKELTSLLSSIYARIDYPDEDLGDFTDSESEKMLRATKNRLVKLKESYKTGRSLTEGIKTVICGVPNVGKSTLYNLLLEKDAAIVTDIAGTTRDVLTERVSIGGVMLSLSDTAGIRESENIDKVEMIGIQRSETQIAKSELIIAVLDGSRESDADQQRLLTELKSIDKPKIAIVNKCDIKTVIHIDKDDFEKVIYTSLSTDPDSSRAKISSVITALFTDEKIQPGEDAIITTARQNSELTRALTLIESALDGYSLGMTQDAVSSDIERALGAISELDGRGVSEAVVSDIFSKFCVGK